MLAFIVFIVFGSRNATPTEYRRPQRYTNHICLLINAFPLKLVPGNATGNLLQTVRLLLGIFSAVSKEAFNAIFNCASCLHLTKLSPTKEKYCYSYSLQMFIAKPNFNPDCLIEDEYLCI